MPDQRGLSSRLDADGAELDVEADVQDVPVLNDVRLALDALLAGAGHLGVRAELDEVVRRIADTLDLITFFTAGEKDTRAWTLRNGQTALDAAGAIHTDIARGFIRAEVLNWQDLVELGSAAEVAKQGKQGLEGKTYVVKDGDVLNIRFNV